MRIGEVAELVGTTTRAIRHYHRIGLVREPARRTNGYRDYDTDDVLRLLHVRSLVRLGVRLDDAAELLRSGDDRSSRDMLQALDAQLAREQARLQEQRDRLQELLSRLPTGDPLQHPDLLWLVSELRAAFPDSTIAHLERQALDLLSHLTPEQLPAVVAQYRTVLTDPEHLTLAHEIDRRFTGLAGLHPDDPEVEAVARLMLLSAGPAATGVPDGDHVAGPAAGLLTDLLTTSLAPAQRRCIERLVALAEGGPA